MDAYLECPQNYIEEHLLEGPSPYLTEYHCIRSEAGRARAALEASLTEEQGALWEAFQITAHQVRSLEDDMIFEKAVALGKWMVLS